MAMSVTPPDPMGGTAASVERAAGLLAAGEYAAADEAARRGLERFGDLARLWECRGLARWMLGEDRDARAALEAASLLAPLHPVSRCALLDLYSRGDAPHAADAIAAFLGQPEQAEVLLAAVTDESRRLGGLDLALRACMAVSEFAPDNHRGLFGLAWCLGRAGASWEDLIAPLALAMDLAPECLHYRVNLAFAWADGGHWARACELLRPVPIQEVPCHCWLRRMAEVFERAGDRPRALACAVRLADGP